MLLRAHLWAHRHSASSAELAEAVGEIEGRAPIEDEMRQARRLFAKESHPLAGKKINMNILGIAGWLPSSLGVKMSPLFNEYVKDRYGYEVSFGFAEAPFSDLFQKAATSLATRSQEYNIIISDSQWLGAGSKGGSGQGARGRRPRLDSGRRRDARRRLPDGQSGCQGEAGRIWLADLQPLRSLRA